MSLPKSVRYVLETLHGAGFSAYVVGGAVRDMLMGIDGNDYDIATSALPEQVTALFGKTNLVIETGIKHGTVTVLCDHEPIEVTTFRIDGDYKDARHPEHVVFTQELAMDLRRRDFTVNAFAYDEREGILDLNGGLDDLENRILRTVGEPILRFSEDALRILRALRFSAKLDFAIEKQTALAIHTQKARLSNISYERIAAELAKLFASVHGIRVASILNEYRDVFMQVIPETGDIRDYEAVCQHVAEISPLNDLRWLYYLSKTGDVTGVCKRLKQSTAFTKHAVNVSAVLDEAENVFDVPNTALLMHAHGKEAVLDAARIMKDIGVCTVFRENVRAVIEQNIITSIAGLAVNGNDLKALGVPPKEIGTTLEGLLADVLCGNVKNVHGDLLENVKKHLSI